MKKTLFLSIALLSVVSVFAQNEKAVLQKADRLIAQRQYATAYSLLDEFDPTNDCPAVLLQKENIMLNYFVQSINHMVFSLQDLKPGDNLDSIRANFESGTMIPFMADSLLKRLIAKSPDDCALLCGYARYYNALLNDYNADLWDGYVDSACLALLRRASAKECGCPDASYQLGLSYNMDGQDDSAAYYFCRTLDITDTHWHAHYNLGVILYGGERYTEALPHFRTALHGYKDPVMKADAAHALGIIFSDYLNLPDSAYFYLQAAHTLIPYDFGYATNLLSLPLNSGDSRANDLIDTCWHLALEGDQALHDAQFLVQLCLSSNAGDRISAFLNSRLLLADNDYERGLCHFLFGIYDLEGDDASIRHLEQAVHFFILDGAPDEFIFQLQQIIEEKKN